MTDPDSAPARDGAAARAALQLEIVYRPIEQLIPYKNNPREHPADQIKRLAKGFRDFGMVQPILLDEAGVIIAGHGRLLAAKLAKLAVVPTVTINHLDDKAKRRLRIADNKHGLNSSWYRDLLKAEVVEAVPMDGTVDVEAMGFVTAEIDVILNDTADVDDDRVPDSPLQPRAKLGDIWILGDHRIACGDARDKALLQRLMGSTGLADMAFVDPPYNVRIDGHANRIEGHREFAMASGEMDTGEFAQFLTESLGAAAGVTRDGGVHFICMDFRHTDELSAAARKVYRALLNLCVWNKSNACMGSLYRSKHELVFVYRVGDAQHQNNVQLGRYKRSRTNVWDYPSVNMPGGSRSRDLKLHPTPKPVAMVADAIKDVTKPGDIVLDTFLGSGTTLIAAERVGRLFRGVEIDPLYVDIAIERWVTMTGGMPVLEAAPSGWGSQIAAAPVTEGWGQAHD